MVWTIRAQEKSIQAMHIVNTTLAALTAGAAVRALGIHGAPARAAPMLAAACVGASRVYLGVHWPADVVAGWLFAEGWLCLTGTGSREG